MVIFHVDQLQLPLRSCLRTRCTLSRSRLAQRSLFLFIPITYLCIPCWMIAMCFIPTSRTYRHSPIGVVVVGLMQLSMPSRALIVDSLHVGCKAYRCHYSHPAAAGAAAGMTPFTRSTSSIFRRRTTRTNSNGGSGSAEETTPTPTPSNNSQLVPGLISTSQIITSKASSTVKLFSNLLSSSKMRKQYNLTVVEGYRLVLDILENPSTAHLLRHILVTEEALYRHVEFSPILQRHLRQVQNYGTSKTTNNAHESPFRIHLVSDNVLTACTDTVTPQGVVATCHIPKPFDPVTYAIHKTTSSPQLFLVLDAISDPGNLGTLIRSSVACGVSAIFLLNGCVDPYSSKALRSAMGGTFRIPIQTFATLQECWDALLQCGVPYERIFAATSETMSQGGDDSTIESSELPAQFSFSSPIHTDIDWIAAPADQHRYYNSAIIIGREGSGLRWEIRNAVTKGLIKSVHVAMDGGMESLNAAICGSVIMFEYARQKREYTRGTNSVASS